MGKRGARLALVQERGIPHDGSFIDERVWASLSESERALHYQRARRNAGMNSKPRSKPASTSVQAKKKRSPAKPHQDPLRGQPIQVRHEDVIPEGLPRKYFLKSTFNTEDIMHAPVEKTLKMLDKILSGERLFTM
ncbi:hypothetical protein ACFL0L_01755 [Patescibacteria group bacterium]